MAPRVSGLANLSEYIDGMEKLIPDRVKQMMKMETGRLMAAFLPGGKHTMLLSKSAYASIWALADKQFTAG